MSAVYKRELASYFRSPVGYIALALFSFLSGFVFINQYGDGSVNISSEIMSLCSFFVVIVPVITMGLFSEDKKRGTEVLFYTNPVSMFDVVLGKFFAAMTLILILFSNVFLHMIIIMLGITVFIPVEMCCLALIESMLVDHALFAVKDHVIVILKVVK